MDRINQTPGKPPPGSLHHSNARVARSTLAIVLLQVTLAQADGLGRDLDQLVVLDELDAIFQRQVDRGCDLDRVFLAGHSEVGLLLGTKRIYDQVVVAAVDFYDHTFVYPIPG